MMITAHLRDAPLEVLGESLDDIVRGARLAMAIHLYGRGPISQGGGALSEAKPIGADLRRGCLRVS
jgi:hypothetical protein